MRCFKKSGCELLLPSHLTFFFLSGSTESQRKTYSASSISCHAISDLHPQPHHQLHPSRLQLPPSIPVLVTIVLLVLLIMLLVFYVMCKIIVHGPTPPPPPLPAAAEEQAQLPGGASCEWGTSFGFLRQGWELKDTALLLLFSIIR